MLNGLRRPSALRLVLAGACIGLAGLTRPVGQAILGVYLVGLLLILGCLLLEHWLARRRSLTWINTAFFRLNAVISVIFLMVILLEVIFQGGFRLR